MRKLIVSFLIIILSLTFVIGNLAFAFEYTLAPNDVLEIKFPVFAGAFKPMEQKGNDLILNFATKGQVAALALTEFYDIQKKKDQAELTGLQVQADKIQADISELEAGKGLTPLGKELLMTKQDIEKQRTQLAELKSQLTQTNVKIEELELKIKSRKFAFSGEVYLRQ